MDAYHMPRVDDLIDRLGKAKYITTLDLSRGHWQVPIWKKDQQKTMFTTPYGLFHEGRMMDVMLDNGSDFAAGYLDDVVIHSKTWDKHLQHVSHVIERLANAGLTVKPKNANAFLSLTGYYRHFIPHYAQTAVDAPHRVRWTVVCQAAFV